MAKKNPFEGSPADKKIEKMSPMKEGSPKELARDKAASKRKKMPPMAKKSPNKAKKVAKGKKLPPWMNPGAGAPMLGM